MNKKLKIIFKYLKIMNNIPQNNNQIKSKMKKIFCNKIMK